MAKTKVLICPYCGETQPVAESCRVCSGLFEPLSRQATHNEMGPWFIRDVNRPFHPGCSYETLVKLIERGQIDKTSILRGPTTKQFWTVARRVPGVSHLLGFCHNCDATVDVSDHGCHACGVPFGAYLDRNYLGLPEIRPMPWDAPVDDELRRNEPAPSRTIDFRRAAEPLGISSFATDEELRQGGHIAYGATGSRTSVAPLGMIAAAAHLPDTHLPDPPYLQSQRVAAPQPATSSQAVRAAEQRIAHQQRIIRYMTVGIVATTIVAMIVIIAVLKLRSQSNDDRATATQHFAPANLPPVLIEPVESQSEPAPAPTAAEFDVHAAMASAQEHIGIAEQSEIPIEERIKEYEAALAILKSIDTGADAAKKPEDLASRMATVERALNELKLRVHFP